MIIDIPKLSAEGSDFEGELPEDLLELAGDPVTRVEAPISCRLRAELVNREMIVRGSVEVRVRQRCSRCAEFFSTRVGDSSFLRAYAVPEGTEKVDIAPDIREAVLLAVPSYPLCSPRCKGLCPRCGKNLNRGPCGCSPQPGAGPAAWSALDELGL